MALQHLRSSTASKRPLPAGMSDGQLAINTNTASPGLFFKDSAGALIKVGPVHVGTTAPNASPASGGQTGNTVGEQWLDTTGGTYVFKVWDGSAWRSETGTFVDVNGDVMTGALGIIAGSAAAPGLYFSGDTNTGLYSPGADQLAISTNGGERLRITSAGLVGIGTSSPGERLEIGNSVAPIDDNTTDGQVERIGRLKFGTTNAFGNRGPTASIDHVIRTDVWGLQNFSSQIAFSTAQNTGGTLTQRAVITNQGYFGVGTTTPSAGIHVNAPASQSAAIFAINTSEAARIDSSGRLLVGTSTARSTFNSNQALQIQLEGTNFPTSSVGIVRNSSNSGAPTLTLAKSRGTAAGSHAIVVADDDLGLIIFEGADGSKLINAARITAQVDGTPGANDMPGRLVFSTTADGANSPTERMRIDSAGTTTLTSSTSTAPFIAKISTSEVARIDSSGRLLVGTSTAYTNIYRLGTASAPAVQIAGSGGDIGLAVIRTEALPPTITLGAGSASNALSVDNSLGSILFNGFDGTNYRNGASIVCAVDGTPGASDMPGRLVFSTTADGASSPTERMRIASTGDIRVTNFDTIRPGATGDTSIGARMRANGELSCSTNSSTALFCSRNVNDGTLVSFSQQGVEEGTISVSGTTVSYNGAHLSRWSQLSGIDPYDKTVRPEILRGTVMSNLDEMCVWTCPTSGDCQDNEQLNKTKISDVEGDKNVAGVFQSWDDDDDTWVNDFYLAMTGDFIIRIAAGVTVERGDLLMSAGNGTAKPQDDDIIRSKTIAKVTSTNVTCTYEDGSYCVPCVLMAC